MPFQLQKLIDRNIGYALCKLFGLFTRIDNNNLSKKFKPKTILIIRLWTIGESILTMPMIHELRKKYPEAQIDVLCYRSSKVFEMNKDVDKIVDLEQIIFSNSKNTISLLIQSHISIFQLY